MLTNMYTINKSLKRRDKEQKEMGKCGRMVVMVQANI